MACALGCASSPPPPRATTPSAVVANGDSASPLTNSEDAGPLPVGVHDPSRGRADALVTLVWFADLQCPFSASAASTVAELQTRYTPDQLRVVWKNLPLPFHATARPAAEHAMAVFAVGGAPAFWKFMNTTTEHYSALEGAPFVEWAAGAGVSSAALAAELASGRPAAKVKADEELAARVGARGTPTFFVNGTPLVGAQPLAKFIALIDAERGRAEQALAQGTPRSGLYTELARAAFATAAAEEPAAERDTSVWRVPIGSSPVRGKPSALVTVVEFSDFQCPFCRRVQRQLEQLREKYGDDVRFVFKQSPLPFHPRAEPAAELALEARAQRGDAGFYDVHDALFGSAGLEDADLEAVARGAHLDLAKVRRALRAHRHSETIAEDLELADELHAAGTPHFFINGRRLVGAQPLETFTALVDEELARARAMVSRGVRADAVYDELQKTALGAAEAARVASVPAPGADQPFIGAPNAKVIIQEFADFECGFCAQADPTVQALLAAYPGKVKVVWRHRPLPMHTHAALASEAAIEAFQQKGNAGFWGYRALLFAAQREDGGLEREALVRYAKKLGLDAQRFRNALDDHRHAAAVQADIAIADSAGISATPTFVVNGAVIEGAQPLAKFRRVVEQALR